MREVLQQEGGYGMSVEECQIYLGDLNFPDKQIEETRDILYAFVEQVLDYVIEEGLVSDKEKTCLPVAKIK